MFLSDFKTARDPRPSPSDRLGRLRQANLLRESTEAREARGLAPLPMGE